VGIENSNSYSDDNKRIEVYTYNDPVGKYPCICIGTLITIRMGTKFQACQPVITEHRVVRSIYPL
jgi:hypothetical protein